MGAPNAVPQVWQHNRVYRYDWASCEPLIWSPNAHFIRSATMNWASPIYSGEGPQALEAARTQGPVLIIATHRQQLHCRPSNEWGTIENDPTLAGFDHVPLTRPDSTQIESIFIRGKGRANLEADMFMAADAPLLTFVETADSQPFRLLVSGGDVAGMVTLSDLQRLPVHSLLFSLLMAVEVLLIEWIRITCRDEPDKWIQHLTPRQQGIIEKQWQQAIANNLEIDRVSCASLGQEITAARALGLFATDATREAQIDNLRQLRDLVCHAIEFAPTPEYALKVPARVREAKDLADWLAKTIHERIAAS